MSRGDSYAPGSTDVVPAVAISAVVEGGGDGIQEILQSVLGQSFQEWRLLVADGSVTDVGDRDPRIHVLRADSPREVPARLAEALRAAAVRYVLPLEAGVALEPTAVEKWFWFLESHAECSRVAAHAVNPGGAESPSRTAMVRVEAVLEAIDRGETWEAALGDAAGATVPEVLVAEPHRARAEADHAGCARWQQPANAWIPHELPVQNRLRGETRRLILVVPWLEIGGADKFNLDLLDQLGFRGWEVTVVTTLPGNSPWLPFFLERTPDVFVLPHFLRLVDYPRFLRYLVGSRGADAILITNSELGYRLLPYLRGFCPDVALVDFCHSEIERWNSGGYPRFSVEYQEQLDLTVTASSHLRSWMEHHGADAERIDVCYAGVDVAALRPDASTRRRTRASFDIPDGVPVVLFVGRLSEDKQPHVLGRSLLELRQRGCEFVALVAGDGPELPWLRSLLGRHRAGDTVRLLGAVSHEEVRNLMCAADVFFLPSLWEGIALTVYEAMACGVAVVAADVGGQSELVTPACGVLVPRSDEETEVRAYADALDGLLADRRRRSAMGEAARARVATEFTLGGMGERMTSLLDRAARLHESAPRPVPSPGVARATAAEAVECARLAQATEWSWREVQAALRAGAPAGWRTHAFVLTKRYGAPFYRWGVARGVTWLPPLKERLVGALMRREA